MSQVRKVLLQLNIKKRRWPLLQKGPKTSTDIQKDIQDLQMANRRMRRLLNATNH